MSESARLFPTTRRSLIVELQAQEPQRREVSLARFCSLYYPALYGFARALGLSEADAKDGVQDFFVKVVQDQFLAKYEPERGKRFSSWLIKCFKNMVFNQLASEKAAKRGGGQVFVLLDGEHAEHSYRAAHLAHLDPGPTFDLLLAREIWLAAKAAVFGRYQHKPGKELVADLLPYVLHERWPPKPMPTQAELAERHGLTAVKLKAFFNRTLKTLVRRSYDEEAQRASPGIPLDELDHLWHLLSRYGE